MLLNVIIHHGSFSTLVIGERILVDTIYGQLGQVVAG